LARLCRSDLSSCRGWPHWATHHDLPSSPLALLTLGPHPSVNCSWPSLPFYWSLSSLLCAVIGCSLSSDSLVPLLECGLASLRRFRLCSISSPHRHTPLPHVSPRPPILRDMGVLWGTEAHACSDFGWAASFHVRAHPRSTYQRVPRTPRPLREAHGEACLVRACVNTASTPVLTPHLLCQHPLCSHPSACVNTSP
jgi:hypothetical protein